MHTTAYAKQREASMQRERAHAAAAAAQAIMAQPEAAPIVPPARNVGSSESPSALIRCRYVD